MSRALRILASILLIAGATSRVASAGPPGFAFLEIPTGTRASALGGAYVSLGQGVDAMFWNPAALADVKGVQMMGGHYELYEKLRHDHFALAGRIMGSGVGGSIRALYSEPIEERDELGNLIGTFGAHDLEFALGLGRTVASGLSIGASAEAVRERISNSAATTYAFGLGAAWEPTGWHGLRLGVSGQNLGPTAAYTIDGEKGQPISLPAALQAGVSYSTDVTTFAIVRAAIEGRLTRGRNGVAMVGAELASPAGAALRVGMRMNDDATGLSVGAGYSLSALRLDYAYVPFRLDLGDSHRFSFAAQF